RSGDVGQRLGHARRGTLLGACATGIAWDERQIAMEILLLGLVEASHDGQALPLGGAKPSALLAILALHANVPVSADRLIEGLWGERPPATAPRCCRCSSRNCASSLRAP